MLKKTQHITNTKYVPEEKTTMSVIVSSPHGSKKLVIGVISSGLDLKSTFVAFFLQDF